MYARARDELGRIDVLFNNAGISPPDDASVLDTSLEAWQRVQDVNLRSVFLCCKHGIPHLLEAGGGSVVNTASFVATMGSAVSQISYTASKGGVLALSRELGIEFARRGVRVNALCPGPGQHAPAPASSSPRTPTRRLAGCPSADGPLRRAGGDRAGRPVPGERRVLVRHRHHLHGGRRARRPPTSRPNSVDEPAAQRAADLVPGADARARLLHAAHPGRARCARRRGRCGSRRSSSRRRRAHLGVELDPPGRALEPDRPAGRPGSGRAPSRSGRERRPRSCATETPRSAAASPDSSGSSAASGVSSTSCQPISGCAARRAAPPAASATSWHPRHIPSSGTRRSMRSRKRPPSPPEPGVVGLLVGVHRAAEREHRVVARAGRPAAGPRRSATGRARRRGEQRLGEDARSGVGLVDDREGAHPGECGSR